MTEPAIDTIPAPASRQDAIAAAGAVADAEAPITKDAAPLTTEDVAGTKPAGEAADRELVAPSIREFLRATAPAPEVVPTALEREIADLRGALDGLAGKAPKAEATVEQQLLEKLEALEARENARLTEDEERAQEQEYNDRVGVLKSGVIENLNAAGDKYPGLIALEQQETVFNALVTRSQEGTETSEDEVASEVEEGLRTVYDTLHKVYGNAPSKDPVSPVSEPKVTLSPALSTTPEAADLEKMSRAERIEYLWERTNKTS